MGLFHFLTDVLQLYVKRVSCAVPLRIVTMKASGGLTPSQPAVINVIPDQVPLIQGRRQHTQQPPPIKTDSYKRKIDARRGNSYEESMEFPNAHDYSGYYYDKDYYKYYKSYYEFNGDLDFHFKHPRYPYGHTVFAEALVMKQVPIVFRDVFFPTPMKVRASSIVVGKFYSQNVPVDVFESARPAAHIYRRTSNQTTPKLKPQTHHPTKKYKNSKEIINSMNFKSILFDYTYKEGDKDMKHSTSKGNVRNDDKSYDSKNFRSDLSYAYNESDDASKYSSYRKKISTLEKRTESSKFRRQLEVTSAPPSALDLAPQTTSSPQLLPLQNPLETTRWDLMAPKLTPDNFSPIVPTTLPPFITRQYELDSPEDQMVVYEDLLPLHLDGPSAAELAIAPVFPMFDKLLRG